ncbi:MAG: DUF393 domain-containing protein [Halobacteria archaeon]|nr:DUF393 domain-containing protein [Halobacteria archaeon]
MLDSDIEYDAVLIYDGDCPYCEVASKALERISGVGALAWGDDESQEFLRAQFGEVPFAMFLADYENNVVYAGEAAAKELAGRAGLPGIVGDLIGDGYDTISSVVGFATRREKDVDGYHHVYEMRDEASEKYAALSETAGSLPAASTD